MRSLRIFVAAFEQGSFTAATQREGATQPGVSKHIRSLEARHGVLLFHVPGRKAALTTELSSPLGGAGTAVSRRRIWDLFAEAGLLPKERLGNT